MVSGPVNDGLDPETDARWAAELAKWHEEAAKRAAKTAHRRVPMPEVEKGHCRWCTAPLIATRGKYMGIIKLTPDCASGR